MSYGLGRVGMSAARRFLNYQIYDAQLEAVVCCELEGLRGLIGAGGVLVHEGCGVLRRDH